MSRPALFAALLLVAAGPWAGAAEPPAPIDRAALSARISSAEVHAGEFEQRKVLAGFRNPLVSRGDYVVSRARGVLWRTREPFPSTAIITPRGLSTRVADGKGADATRRQPVDAAFVTMVNGLLVGLMTGDIASLERYFTIEGEVPASGPWQLRLKPRDATLGRMLSAATVEGDREVGRVTWREARGDSGSLVFSKQRTASALTPAEAREFD